MNPESTFELFSEVESFGERPSIVLEQRCRARGWTAVAGVDEAGRGSLCGPVVAAAVILPDDCLIDGVTDSKLLPPEKRTRLAVEIKRHALAFATGSCSPDEIDRMNILRAALEAMRRAVAALRPPADFLLIDGNFCPAVDGTPARAVVKGDLRSHSIAAASIIAKTTRDAWMAQLHEEYPLYGWDTNMGYATPGHYLSLSRHGPTPHHRRSFRLS